MSTFGLVFSLGAVLGIALPAQPPATPQKPVTDTYYTVKVTDNYRWLEKYSDPAVRKWSDDQNRYARRYIDSLPARPALFEQLKLGGRLIAPVGATPAFAHGTHKLTVGEQTFSTFQAFSYCQAFNVFDLPVVTVPAGRSAEGLPIGVQIVGLPFAEETVLAAAAIIEQAMSDN